MMQKAMRGVLVLLAISLAGCSVPANAQPDVQAVDHKINKAVIKNTGGIRHLMRYADVYDDQIVFTWEDDLWLVSTEGGEARRLTRDPGKEYYAKFSPDGTKLAFTAEYDGNSDVYVMDSRGGSPRRLTFHPMPDVVADWWPDGKSIVFRSRREWSPRAEELYRISIEGGMPEKMPVDRAGLAAVSPDETRLAYNRISREAKTWKRHKGGTAQNIWLGDMDTMNYKPITEWKGSDNFPMWFGNETICFNSDREYGTLNLYKKDLKSGAVTPLTEYKEYDVKYPSIGGDQIVFQHKEMLHLLDLNTGEVKPVHVIVRSDRVLMRPEYVRISPRTGSFGLSPTGKRLLLEARGDIFNLPAEEGTPINITDTPGSREKNAAWSPDGKWIAFVSDKTGEEEFYLADQKGDEPWTQITEGGNGFNLQPVWSPDSTMFAYSDKFLKLHLVHVESKENVLVDQGDFDDGWERWGIQDYTFSPDNKWIAYTKLEECGYESIYLYNIADQTSTRVTGEMTQDWSPSFDPDGKYLYFLSNRTFNPIMGQVDQNHIYNDMALPYLVVLANDVDSPFVPEDVDEDILKSDEEDSEEKPAEEEKEEDSDEAEEDDSIQIDLTDINRRIVGIPGVSAGNYFRLDAVEGGFLYLCKPGAEFLKYQAVTDQTGGRLDLYHYNLDDEEATKLMGGVANYHLSADGKKKVCRSGSTYGVTGATANGSASDGEVDLSRARVKVSREEEFLQAFNEAWRVQRNWFYDEDMHGVDWKGIGYKYRQFIPSCGNRGDLNYLIGEMIGELNIGHTYVWGGDIQSDPKRVPTGLLGAKFETADGADYYRFSHIIPSYPSTNEWSPIDRPGNTIQAGDYLIAIDGKEIRTTDNIYEALQNKANTWVTLTFNDEPSADGAEERRAKTLRNEFGLQYREWVESRRQYVAEQTNGEIGYLHIPDMGESGLIEFARLYYPQFYKKGIIIDERYNGGGFVADMIIDRLERQLWSYTIPREGKQMPNPERCFNGHFIVMVNEDTGSCGEFFATAIQVKGLAPVLGMRTWGGAIGIEPHQPLVDGGTVTPPQFGLYGLDGSWLIEGTGVIPDIEVQNWPGNVVRGEDQQLDAAIKHVLKAIEKDPRTVTPVPAYPDKSKAKG